MAMPLQAEQSDDHYTVEDWLDLPESDGQRVELLDGSFVVSPAPKVRHQLCAGRLRTILAAAAPLNLDAVEAVGVRFADDALVPDVVVGDAKALVGDPAILLPEHVRLVAEVVSRGNHRRDYDHKPQIYAEGGIPTFLRIELAGATAPDVEVLRLLDGGYTLVAKASAGQTLELTEPFPVAFDPAVLTGYRSQ